MKFFLILLFQLFFVNHAYSFPGDQDPLSCVFAFNPTSDEVRQTIIARQKLFAKGLAKSVTVIENGEPKVYDFTYGSDYQTTNHPSLSEEEYKAKMKSEAEAQFRTAIRKFHDRSVSITKLGDSLSDLVDVYGVIKPEYWGLHPAFVSGWLLVNS